MSVVEEEAKKSNSKTLSAALQQIRSLVETLPADAPGQAAEDPWRPAAPALPPAPPSVPRTTYAPRSTAPPATTAAAAAAVPTQQKAPSAGDGGAFGAPTPASGPFGAPARAPRPTPGGGSEDSMVRLTDAELRMKELQESVLARETEMRELREQLQKALAAAQANGQQAKVARAAVSAARDLASALQVEIESLEAEVTELRISRQKKP